MYYKTMAARLSRCGWEITDEGHGGNIYAHYYKYNHPADESRDSCYTIELFCSANKDGTPGKIVKAYQGGHLVRL